MYKIVIEVVMKVIDSKVQFLVDDFVYVWSMQFFV